MAGMVNRWAEMPFDPPSIEEFNNVYDTIRNGLVDEFKRLDNAYQIDKNAMMNHIFRNYDFAWISEEMINALIAQDYDFSFNENCIVKKMFMEYMNSRGFNKDLIDHIRFVLHDVKIWHKGLEYKFFSRFYSDEIDELFKNKYGKSLVEHMIRKNFYNSDVLKIIFKRLQKYHKDKLNDALFNAVLQTNGYDALVWWLVEEGMMDPDLYDKYGDPYDHKSRIPEKVEYYSPKNRNGYFSRVSRNPDAYNEVPVKWDDDLQCWVGDDTKESYKTCAQCGKSI